MGVTTTTLWRWENGLAKPSKLYLKYLKSLEQKGKEKTQLEPNMIRAIRKSNNMTQEEFAKELGTNVPTLADWESGRHKPRKTMQKKIYDFYLKHKGD